MLYQFELGGCTVREVKAGFDPFEYLAEREATGEFPPEIVRQALDFAHDLLDGTLSRLGEIDELVKGQAENWRLERMPAVDRNILRLAVYELLAEPDVPPLVVLDEAIELAKAYGSDRSGAFVNGLLDGLLKSGELAGTQLTTE